MRDSGTPEVQALTGLDWFAGLAKEAVSRLVSVRDQESTVVRQDHLDHFMQVLVKDRVVDPGSLLAEMLARQLDPVTVACLYAPAAARILGECWEKDQMSFIDVTLATERLHGLVRQVDDLVASQKSHTGPSALVLVADAEQHTLGATVLALELRLAGFTAIVRVAPMASDLSQLIAANRFDLALVSLGCTAGLDSAVGLVRTLKRLSRGELCVFVGGAIPIEDALLRTETGADRVLRDVSTLKSEYDACRGEHQLDRDQKRSQRSLVQSLLKGD